MASLLYLRDFYVTASIYIRCLLLHDSINPKAKYSGEYLRKYFLLDAIPRTTRAYN